MACWQGSARAGAGPSARYLSRVALHLSFLLYHLILLNKININPIYSSLNDSSISYFIINLYR